MPGGLAAVLGARLGFGGLRVVDVDLLLWNPLLEEVEFGQSHRPRAARPPAPADLPPSRESDRHRYTANDGGRITKEVFWLIFAYWRGPRDVDNH